MSDPRSRGSRTGARIINLLSAALCVAGLALGCLLVTVAVVPVAALLGIAGFLARYRRFSSRCEPAFVAVLAPAPVRSVILVGANGIVASAVVADLGVTSYGLAASIAAAFVAVSAALEFVYRRLLRATVEIAPRLLRPVYALTAFSAFIAAKVLTGNVEFGTVWVTMTVGAALVVLAALTSVASSAFAATWPAGQYRNAAVGASVAALEVLGLSSAGVSLTIAMALLPFLVVGPWYAQYETRHMTT